MTLSRYLESQLFGLAPTDPSTELPALVGLLAIAALASLFPARRAAEGRPFTGRPRRKEAIA